MRTTRLSMAVSMAAAVTLVGMPAFAVEVTPEPSPSTGSTPTSEPSQTPTDKPSTPSAGYPLQVKVSAPTNQGINKVGQSVRWDVVVKNSGEQVLSNVAVAISIPADGSLRNLMVSPAEKQGSYTEGTWSIAEVAPQTELRATVTAEVASLDVATGYFLTAQATADGITRPQGVQANTSLEADTDGADTLPVGLSMPYLQVDVAAGSKVASKAGDQMSWTVSLSNKGLSTASGIKVSLAGQNGTDESSIKLDTGGKGTYDPATRTWSLPSLSPTEGTLTATVTATIAAGSDLTQAPSLSARASSAEVPQALATCTLNTSLDADTDACDHETVALNTSKLAVDLELDKGQAIYGAGDVATWSVTVKNLDTRSVASDVRVVDEIGAHLVADSLSWGSASQGSVDGTVWKVGDLAPGASATIKVSVEVAEGTKVTDRPTNKVYAVSATQATPTQCGAQDGVAADTDRCDARAITLSTRPAPVLKVDVEPKKGSTLNSRSDRITYQVKVANTGNKDASRVVIAAKPGKQADLKSVKWNNASPGGKLDTARNTLALSSIKANSAATVEISMTPSQAANLAQGMDLRVSASAADLPATGTCVANAATDDTDRCDTATVGTGNVKLKIDKTVVTPKTVLKAGSQVSWVVTVKNAGTSTAKDVLVTLTPSTGLAKGSMVFVGKVGVGTVNNTAGTWKIPTLPAGASLTATARGTVDSGQTYATNIVAFADVTNPLAPLTDPGQCVPNKGVDQDGDQCDYDALAYRVQVSSNTTPGSSSTVPGPAGTEGSSGVEGKGVPGKGQPVLVAAGEPAPLLSNLWSQVLGVVMTGLGSAVVVMRLRSRIR